MEIVGKSSFEKIWECESAAAQWSDQKEEIVARTWFSKGLNIGFRDNDHKNEKIENLKKTIISNKKAVRDRKGLTSGPSQQQANFERTPGLNLLCPGVLQFLKVDNGN